MTKLQDSALVKKVSQEGLAMNASLVTEKPRPKLPPALVSSSLCYPWAGCTRLCVPGCAGCIAPWLYERWIALNLSSFSDVKRTNDEPRKNTRNTGKRLKRISYTFIQFNRCLFN